MKVRYIGPHAAVEATSGGRAYPAERGEEIEVPDDVGASLVEQTENWVAVASKRGKSAAAADEGASE